MGILESLASIPTASNLALKLKDAESELKSAKERNAQLVAENAVLSKTVEQLNAQVLALTQRVVNASSPCWPSQRTAESLPPTPWKAREW